MKVLEIIFGIEVTNKLKNSFSCKLDLNTLTLVEGISNTNDYMPSCVRL